MTIQEIVSEICSLYGHAPVTGSDSILELIVSLDEDRRNAIVEMEACHKCWDDFTEKVCQAIPEMRNAPLFQQADSILKVIGELRYEVASQNDKIAKLIGNGGMDDNG